MEDGRKSAFTGRRLLEVLSGEAEVALDRPHPAPSTLKAMVETIKDLVGQRATLIATIVELEARLAVSEELVGQLRQELARKLGRPSGKGDPSGVKRLVRPSDSQ